MKKILIALVILIIILLALIFYQKSRINDDEGIQITFQNRKFFLTFSNIRLNEQISFTTNRDDSFNGYDLSSILISLDIPTDNDSQYIFHSQDGGTLNLTKEVNEIFYLIFQQEADGQYIRLVIPTDEFSQRWMKYLIAIEVK
ncbi:MAG: hypothetical protein PF570_02340 [Candidatus Cloacimonetes bacterium]|nr:hypothetical protein [Candidatus Cloacimonadota bacterium]